MRHAPAILALLIAAAGWYYLFYSKAVTRLGAIEPPAMNLKRRRLRRVNGIAMFALATLFFAGFYTVDADTGPQAYVLVWLGVFVLLLIVVILAAVDIRLTAKLRRRF